ncbi:MAG TPA: hypothetical protein VMH80_03650 [Bryobacteraceae bacterium]|nr:hypothetical protein [Bryobacteraceae bacterium]
MALLIIFLARRAVIEMPVEMLMLVAHPVAASGRDFPVRGA